LIKRQIERATRDGLTTALEYIDGQLVGVRDRYAAAKQSDEAGRTDALRAAFKRERDQASTTASSVASKGVNRNSTFKMVAKRDSAIIQAGHDSGVANRAQERADIAKQGETWHSEAYVDYFPWVVTIS
jgi:hypothetical protein